MGNEYTVIVTKTQKAAVKVVSEIPEIKTPEDEQKIFDLAGSELYSFDDEDTVYEIAGCGLPACKREFTEACGGLLRLAKPHLYKCRYMTGKQAALENIDVSLKGRLAPDGEYAVVYTANGFCYAINITANSNIAIASAIFGSMEEK